MHFNLLPWRAKRDRRRQRRFYGLVIASGVLTGLIQGWVFSDWQALADEQAKRLSELEVRLAEYEETLTHRAAKQEIARFADKEMQDAFDVLQALDRSTTSVSAWLVEVMAIRPSGVWLEHMAVRPTLESFETKTPTDQPEAGHWLVNLSGHAVLDRDWVLYQEALADRFGHQKERVQPLDQKPAMPWATGNTQISDERENTALPESPGLETFSIQQWIENP